MANFLPVKNSNLQKALAVCNCVNSVEQQHKSTGLQAVDASHQRIRSHRCGFQQSTGFWLRRCRSSRSRCLPSSQVANDNHSADNSCPEAHDGRNDVLRRRRLCGCRLVRRRPIRSPLVLSMLCPQHPPRGAGELVIDRNRRGCGLVLNPQQQSTLLQRLAVVLVVVGQVLKREGKRDVCSLTCGHKHLSEGAQHLHFRSNRSGRLRCEEQDSRAAIASSSI